MSQSLSKNFANAPDLKADFQNPPLKKTRSKPKPPKPYSIRLTDEERAILRRECGSRSWSGHIRKKLFDGQIPAGRTVSTRKPRLAPEDHKALAELLATLGGSRLSQNLNQIAKAANMGALPLTPDLVTELHQAFADIQHMRFELISALGLRDGRQP